MEQLWDITPYQGGSFACIDNGELYILSPAAQSEIQDKREITLYELSFNSAIASWAASYNSQSDEYFVTVTDLSEQAASADAALAYLNMQLLSDTGPDIVLFSNISWQTYAAKGYLMDLYPFIESEQGLSRNDYLGVGAMESGAALYAISPGFAVDSCIGLRSDHDDAFSWTLGDFSAAEDGLADGELVMFGSSQGDMLYHLFLSYSRQFIDWENRTCSFERDEFISILNTAASMASVPKEELAGEYMGMQPGGAVARGLAKTEPVLLMNVYDYLRLEGELERELSLIGWPSPQGECGSYLRPIWPLGISSRARERGGAWDFIRYVTSEREIQSDLCGTCFPVSRRALAELLASLKAQRTDESGRLPELYGSLKLSDRQERLIISLLERLSATTAVDNELYGIIRSEAAACFAGDKSAAEAAAAIQSRVGLYLAEQG